MATETKFTPGPWRWEINLKSRSIDLVGGRPRFDMHLLTFQRWGMTGATPAFISLDPMKLITKAEAFAVPIVGREHHASWCQTLDHPDANLIAAAPDLYAALEALLNGGPMEETIPIAEAALAKARGEAS